MGQLSSHDRLAAGVHAPPGLMAEGFAATQAAWRFYGNDRVGLPMLAGPLLDHARAAVPAACDGRALVVLDWCNLHLGGHDANADRVELSSGRDLGYELLTALAVSDRDGSPLAPACVELRAADGVRTTRSGDVLPPASVLDGVAPVMAHVAGLGLGRPPVFIVDKEADSVAHYRAWSAAGHEFLVRANDARQVLHDGVERTLAEVAGEVRRDMRRSRAVQYHGRPATQFVAEATVLLARPAYPKRTADAATAAAATATTAAAATAATAATATTDAEAGKKPRKRPVVHGPALALRLIVAEVRDGQGKVLARWLLLTNVAAAAATADTVALWYYWRWRIESYHKLLKGAGHQVEGWRQESAAAFARRLLVTAMAAVVAWQLARDDRPEAEPLRDLLVRLSGRQLDRARNDRGHTEPMLLAGLCVLVPMLVLLETTPLAEVRAVAGPILEMIRAARPPPKGGRRVV
jgi:hypothetical protein